MEIVESAEAPKEDDTNNGGAAVEASTTAEKTESAETPKEKNDKQTLEESIHAKYERIKRGNLHITDLQNLDVVELHSIARKEGINDYMGLAKQELIFRILKERVRQDGLMYGEGVLEILPDGFGFLRSPKYSYIASPDDVY
ncbi:MAG: transcription termination factor Rho, partial [Smithella sp.]|nr:transcription termination factor Rho [Smithella sp.]